MKCLRSKPHNHQVCRIFESRCREPQLADPNSVRLVSLSHVYDCPPCHALKPSCIQDYLTDAVCGLFVVHLCGNLSTCLSRSNHRKQLPHNAARKPPFSDTSTNVQTTPRATVILAMTLIWCSRRSAEIDDHVVPSTTAKRCATLPKRFESESLVICDEILDEVERGNADSQV
jgi:hypothetical protein